VVVAVLAAGVGWCASAAAQEGGEPGVFEPVRVKPDEISVAQLEEMYSDANRLIQRCRLDTAYARQAGPRRLAEAYYIRVIYASVRLGKYDVDSGVNMLFLAPDMVGEVGLRGIVDEEGWPDAWLYHAFGPEEMFSPPLVEPTPDVPPEPVEPLERGEPLEPVATPEPVAPEPVVRGASTPGVITEYAPLPRPRVGLKVRTGASYYYTAHLMMALGAAFHVRPTLLINLEFQTLTSQTDVDGNQAEVWLISWAVGLGYKNINRRVRPFIGLDFTAILYQVHPSDGARFAPGFRGNGGVEVMVNERFGLFAEGHLGAAYAQNIADASTEEDAWEPFQMILAGGAGVVLQL